MPVTVWAQWGFWFLPKPEPKISESDRLKCRIHGQQAGHRAASRLSLLLHPQIQIEVAEIIRKSKADYAAKVNPTEKDWQQNRTKRSNDVQRRWQWELSQVVRLQTRETIEAEKACLRNPKVVLIESTEINLYDKYPIHNYLEGPSNPGPRPTAAAQ